MRTRRIHPRSRGHVRHSLTLVLLLITLLVAGCGTKTVTVSGVNGQPTTQTVKNIHFANTKFVLHMGLAFGAFHRYIYRPLRAGQLRAGAPHRLATLAKAAVAGAFIVHELRIAKQDAESSDQLRPLLVRLDNAEARLAGLIPGLRHGSSSVGAVSRASGATNSLGAASHSLGFPIRDISHPI